MEKILRTDSDNPDFRRLVSQLDIDLNGINGEEQSEYDKHNVIDFLDTVVLFYLDNKPIGCGAFKEFDRNSAEIKRIYIEESFRGRGFSKRVVRELEDWAKSRGYSRSVLETGKKQTAAIGLYSSLGYSKVENYGPYIGLSNSVCMARDL